MEIRVTPQEAELSIGILIDGKERFEATERLSHSELIKKVNENEYQLVGFDIDTNGDTISNVTLQIGGVDVEFDQKEPDLSPPPVPDIDTSEMSETYRARYHSLNKEGTQPNVIRRIIYENEKLTRGELKDILKESGFEGVKKGESHSGVNATLRILDEHTNEIEREGRGESKKLRWVGHDEGINADTGRSHIDTYDEASVGKDESDEEYIINLQDRDETLATFSNDEQADVMADVVNHLIENFDLASEIEPLPYIPGNEKAIINDKPSSPHNEEEMKTYRELNNGYYLDAHLNKKDKKSHLRRLAEKSGLDIAFAGKW